MAATPTERSIAATIAACARWAQEPDRAAATKPGLTGFMAKFERQVDPEGTLPPEERAVRAAAARRAHMLRLALASKKARQARAAKKAGAA